MTKIVVSKRSPSLSEVLQLAGDEDLLIETMEGRHFVLAELDDFAEEVRAVVKNKALMKLLAERSKEKKTIPLAEVRARLNGNHKTPGKARKAKRR